MKSARVVDCDRSRSSNGIWPALAPIATWARAGMDWKSPIGNHCFPIWLIAGIRIGLMLLQLERKEFRFDINRTVSPMQSYFPVGGRGTGEKGASRLRQVRLGVGDLDQPASEQGSHRPTRERAAGDPNSPNPTGILGSGLGQRSAIIISGENSADGGGHGGKFLFSVQNVVKFVQNLKKQHREHV